MKIYASYSFGYANEFTISASLVLEDDGRFSYWEDWISYGGGAGGEVRGTWRKSGDALYLLAEHKEGPMSLNFVEGQELLTTESGGTVDFGGDLKLTLKRDDSVRVPQPREAEEIIEPPKTADPSAAVDTKQLPVIARFHFKDGRIEEGQLPNDPLFKLFDQLFYRLVDGKGNVTHLFRLRQGSKDSGPLFLTFDEIDITPTEESDEFPE